MGSLVDMKMYLLRETLGAVSNCAFVWFLATGVLLRCCALYFYLNNLHESVDFIVLLIGLIVEMIEGELPRSQ
jgi:hypothetical protein